MQRWRLITQSVFAARLERPVLWPLVSWKGELVLSEGWSCSRCHVGSFKGYKAGAVTSLLEVIRLKLQEAGWPLVCPRSHNLEGVMQSLEGGSLALLLYFESSLAFFFFSGCFTVAVSPCQPFRSLSRWDRPWGSISVGRKAAGRKWVLRKWTHRPREWIYGCGEGKDGGRGWLGESEMTCTLCYI